MFNRPAHTLLAARSTIVFCPHGRTEDLPPSLPAGTICCREWPQVLRWAEERVGRSPSMIVFTEGSLQIPVATKTLAVLEPQVEGVQS